MCCGNTTQTTPPISAQIVTASKAAGRVFGAIVENRPVFVASDVAESRLGECRHCEHSQQFGNGFMKCTICGCGLNGKVRRKAYLATETCPKGKWQ